MPPNWKKDYIYTIQIFWKITLDLGKWKFKKMPSFYTLKPKKE